MRNAMAATTGAKAKGLALLALACAVLACILLAGCASSQANNDGSDEGGTGTVVEEASGELSGLRIGSLKGPTSIGLAHMMADEEGVFTVAASADEIAPKLLRDELDVALVPANLAATLYQKTGGEIVVLDVNTLGVLYAVTASDVDSVEGLQGRTVYMTGMGSVPEYTVNALLAAAGVPRESVDIQFRSEPAEVAALASQDPESVGILPQPYATSATMNNGGLSQTIDLTQAWEEATRGERGSLITGVTIAKRSTVDAETTTIDAFIRAHAASVLVAQQDPNAIAAEVASLGIIDNEKLAEQAIPLCNVVCLYGSEMKDALQGYLAALFEQDPTAVGGQLPNDDFYYGFD